MKKRMLVAAVLMVSGMAWAEKPSVNWADFKPAVNQSASAPPSQPPRPLRNERVSSRPSYEIETEHNDEIFIINGEKFEAKTYCFNMEEGDYVIFLDGSPLGACTSATLLNLRTREKCEVWCE